MKQLLDSDIFIDFLRGYTPAQAWFASLDWEETAFSAITEGELLSGQDCNDAEARQKTLTLLQAATKVILTNEIAKKAGDLRREYHIPMIDAFVAASALTYKLLLITRNVKHYQNVKGLEVQKPYE